MEMFSPRSGQIAGVSQGEFDSFKRRQARLLRGIWTSILVIAVASGFALTMVSSVGVGLLVAAAAVLLGYESQKRWNRRRWLARFPQLQQVKFEWKHWDPRR